MPDSTQQLAAIMFTDIVGYTALMGEDVESGLALLRKSRNIQKPLIEKYNGIWLKEMGDGILARFNTAIDSVLCALEIQNSGRQELNAKIRIGIHLGDVTIENEDVFGDGVNIASRLQSIADPGGIYVSESIYEAIRARKDIACGILGEIQLKNVDHLVKTYYLINDGLPVPTLTKKKDLLKTTDKLKHKKVLSSAIALVVIIVATLVTLWILNSRSAGIRSIAVLPVENLSGNEDEEWMNAGIHNGLIDEMVKIQELRVITRRSTLKYASVNLSIPEIASELEVDGIIEASFSKNGDNINIQVRLIQVHPKEKLLWNISYERPMENIMNTYSDVARAIAQQINISLSAEEEFRLSSTRKVNPDAYEAYLKGMFYWKKLSEKDLNTAMQYFELAVDLDPDFALGYFGISSVWGGLMQGGYLPRSIAGPKSEEAFEKALSLDSTIIEAHYKLALHNTWGYWNWEIAEKEFHKTLKLNPNHVEANAYYAHYLATMGRPEDALPYIERAYEYGKLEVLVHGLYGMALRHARRPEDAIDILEKSLEKFPGEMMIFSTLRSAYHDVGMYDKAIDAGIKYYEIRKDTAAILALEQGYRKGGYQHALQRNAEKLIAQQKIKYITPWQITTLYMRAGMKEEALEWLEKAYDEHDSNMPYITADPIFDDLKDDPRFQEIVRKMKLPG